VLTGTTEVYVLPDHLGTNALTGLIEESGKALVVVAVAALVAVRVPRDGMVLARPSARATPLPDHLRRPSGAPLRDRPHLGDPPLAPLPDRSLVGRPPEAVAHRRAPVSGDSVRAGAGGFSH
jgi:hypothetical protein